MKTYTEQEVVEILKKFNRQQTRNVNSDKWYLQWLQENENTPVINIEKEREKYEGVGVQTGIIKPDFPSDRIENGSNG